MGRGGSSPETKRKAKERREAKRGGPAMSPQERGHISNTGIFKALTEADKSKRFAAAAANAHPKMKGKARQDYIKEKIAQTEDPSKYGKKKRKRN